MYLQSLEITNFRKFGTKNNKVEFVQSDYRKATSNSTKQVESKSFVACATTLIIGKNNAGKTTVTKALKQVVEPENIMGTTFNLTYLRDIFTKYTTMFSSTLEQQPDELEFPTMMFKLNIGLDTDPSTISVQNLKQFIPIKDNEINKIISLTVKFVIREHEKYQERVKNLFINAEQRKKQYTLVTFLN